MVAAEISSAVIVTVSPTRATGVDPPPSVVSDGAIFWSSPHTSGSSGLPSRNSTITWDPTTGTAYAPSGPGRSAMLARLPCGHVGLIGTPLTMTGEPGVTATTLYRHRR